jgi:tripartite-type tricarboxylate transporter receptor subunit TctC
VPFNWSDLTPVAMLALDEFVLWVNAETPYKTPRDYINAIKAGQGGPVQDGRHGIQAGRPDHHGRAREGVGKKMTYVPFKGGGDVAVQLVGKHVDSTVNNPIEADRALALGRAAAAVRVRRQADALSNKVTTTQSWQDIPTCKSQGLNVEYLMLRGFFMPAACRRKPSTSTSTCFKKVRALPEWKKFRRTRPSTTRS